MKLDWNSLAVAISAIVTAWTDWRRRVHARRAQAAQIQAGVLAIELYAVKNHWDPDRLAQAIALYKANPSNGSWVAEYLGDVAQLTSLREQMKGRK